MKTHVKQIPFGVATSTLTRADFLRTMSRGAVGAAAGFSGLGVGLLGASRAFAADADVVEVWPIGVFPYDFEEVRAAVNGGVGPSGRDYGAGGGVVRLKATNAFGVPTYFNFGDGDYTAGGRATLEITKDVVILGEAMASIPASLPSDPDRDAAFKPDRTVIYGGKRPFHCRGTNPVATRLTVRNLYFAYPSLMAVQVRKTSGLEVSDCVIYDVRTDWTTTTPPFQAAVGIEATGQGQSALAVSGEFRVVNNRIWRRPPAAPTSSYRVDTGIVVQQASMSAQVSANEVTGFAFQGIGVDRNEGPVVITDNHISRCGYGPAAVSGVGISGGIGARGTTQPVVVERNRIECGEHGPLQWSKNGIVIASANVFVRSNTVTGHVMYDGIQLTTYTQLGVTFTEADSRLLNNDLINLIAGRSQVFIGAQCPSNQLTNNGYGSVGTGAGASIPGAVIPLAGIVVVGNDNALVNEQFWGSYLGTAATTPLPCIWLQSPSSGNRVTALKYGSPPQGADVCMQVLDEGSNLVPGFERCRRR